MNKISSQFSARLTAAKPMQKVHAVLLLTPPDGEGPARRPTREERQAQVAKIRDSATEALKQIDEILQQFGGRRISDQPTALGTVAIESTAAGISALAASPHVKAILEDQPIARAF
jgi:hypothetical protein